jgi:hypothetical protein
MPENGHVMRNVVCAYARAVDDELAQWIEQNVTFPSTATARQRFYHHARRRFRLVWSLQIGGNQRVIELQLTGGRRDVLR